MELGSQAEVVTISGVTSIHCRSMRRRPP